jgi:hypothetical protein
LECGVRGVVFGSAGREGFAIPLFRVSQSNHSL